ncbi:unnamed protein product [Cylindrotheca closterium]|uniref:Uncharacterized protein n=1 Tax=Cylindrotheca closterium TaxID=2856 RepID=A0AAD2JK79_9STRA|nr:unnamed protein product [Cylindrotheca closterium]
MDSDMMRHWGRRDVYDDWRHHSDSDNEDENKHLRLRGPLMSIAEVCEDSSQEISHHSRTHGTEYGGEGKEENKVDDRKEDERGHKQNSVMNNSHSNKVEEEDHEVSDHKDEDFMNVPLHSAYGLQAEDLMLKNSMALPTGDGGKYRTVSVFGGVFGMLPDPVDSDNLSLSSASDGFSSDDDVYSPPKRSPKRKVGQRRNAGAPPLSTIEPPKQTTPPAKAAAVSPRVVSPPSAASPPSITATGSENNSPPATATTSTEAGAEAKPDAATASVPSSTSSPTQPSEKRANDDSSMTRALKAFDQTESLLCKVLGDLESAPFYAVPPQVMEDAITTLQVSKQSLESALCLEDVVLSC